MNGIGLLKLFQNNHCFKIYITVKQTQRYNKLTGAACRGGY